MLPSNSCVSSGTSLVGHNATFSGFVSFFRFVPAFKVAGSRFWSITSIFVIIIIVLPNSFPVLLQPLGIAHLCVHGLQCKLHGSIIFFPLLCLSFWRMLCTSKRKMKLGKEEKDFNGSLNSMSALVLSISTSCRVPLNCPVIAVRGTQSIAWWKHMNHSNKPFHMLCLKTPQELIKIRTNNFISIYYFLFFCLFQILPC